MVFSSIMSVIAHPWASRGEEQLEEEAVVEEPVSCRGTETRSLAFRKFTCSFNKFSRFCATSSLMYNNFIWSSLSSQHWVAASEESVGQEWRSMVIGHCTTAAVGAGRSQTFARELGEVFCLGGCGNWPRWRRTIPRSSKIWGTSSDLSWQSSSRAFLHAYPTR